MAVFRGQQGAGAREPDVAHDLFWIECKRGKRPNVVKALAQAADDSVEAEDYRIPVAITRADKEQPVVSMRLVDWMALVEEVMVARKKLEADE